jgi:hypothetical protein
MTQITNPIETMTASGFSISPAELLLHLVVTLLAPMFLVASGGDIRFARMAALETVTAYRACNQADLIAIAQIIACGLSALGSLSLSMADDLSLSMTLRLRGNAVALNRVAEQNRRALRGARSHTAAPADTQPTAEPDDDFDEAAVVANVAALQKRAAENLVRQAAVPDSRPAPARIEAPTSVASVAAAERQVQAMWASAMTEVAGEFTASLPHLPPAARKMATVRAAALSSSANALLSGTVPPRLGPGDLAAIMQPNPA